MLLRVSCLASSVLLCCAMSVGQAEATRHHLFGSFVGNSYSGFGINYEYRMRENVWAGLGVGFSRNKTESEVGDKERLEVLSAPFMFSKLWGCGANKFETGAGLTYFFTTIRSEAFMPLRFSSMDPMLSFGYRRMPDTAGFTCRLTVHLVFERKMVPSFGIGVGYTF